MPFLFFLLLGSAGAAVAYQKLAKKRAAALGSSTPVGTAPTLDGQGVLLEEVPLMGTIALERQKQYLALLRLTGLEAMFGTKSAVEDKFRAIGFSAVFVWGADDPIPAYFPVRAAPDKSGTYYWAQGYFQEPNASVEVPAQMVRVWRNRGETVMPTMAGALVGVPNAWA